jgi:amino acid adenylation domain-containing protein
VAVRSDAAQRELLAAYVVCAGPPAAPPDGWLGPLQIALAAALEDQPVPFAVVACDEIPLTAGGEVLLASLPLPAETFAPQELFLRPTTETERRMEAIWRKVLPDQPIGIADNFFGLGGHSLSMIVLIKRISQELDVDVPLATFMQAPTLQAVSRVVDAALGRDTAPGPSKASPAPARAEVGPSPAASPPAIIPLSDAERRRPLPLSFAQARIWFITRLEEERSSYNIPGALLFTGPLGRESLRRTFETIVARHTILRTVYREEDRQPVQVILDRVTFSLPLIDLDGLSPEAQARCVGEQVRAESIRPFDLAAEPSLRALLLKLAAQKHVLLVTLHHIASDGWSIGVLIRELNAVYGAYRQGRPNPLPELPVQYCDYAVWQREWQRTHLDEHLTFWQERLSGIPKVHNLPLDKSRPAYQSYAGAHHAVMLGREVARGLEELSRSRHGTLFITLQAALAVLIHRFSGETDVVIGAPVANRLQREVEPLIGCFVNTLVLRSDLAGNPRFSDLLAAAGESVQRAYAHQSVPFELVVEALNPARDLSHAPLFQILLAFQNDEGEELDLPDLAFTRVESDYPISKFDLTLYARQMPEGLSLLWEYATGIFTRETVESLASSFGVLLESIVRAPAERIDKLRLTTREDELSLLRQAGGTASEPEDGLCIHELFEARARERPEAVAVTSRQGALTYGVLNERADRLACHLRHRGMGAGTLVGICTERSLEMIVGLLAILKAGGAYLPLDAAYPPERLRYMVEDSGAGVVLTSRALRERLPVSSRPLLLLDDPVGDGLPMPPAAALGPDSLAYVIYTSGSTGQPKGAAIAHRGVTRLVCKAGYVELGPETVTLQHSAMSFDTSTFEIWAPLLNGGVLALLDGDSADLEGLARQVETYGVNTLWLTSGVLPLWVEHHTPELGLRYLLVGGDVVPPRCVEEIYRRDDRVTVINGYGPTENTTFSCCYRVPRDRAPVAALPIGEPARRTGVYVLDPYLRLQPVSCPGELHVGGAGVARGYVNQPRLTGRKFVPHPFSTAPGERLYKTGDIVRWLPDGNLGFLGRRDQQVKVRGFRVELGDIESHLFRLPEIADCVVLASDVRGTGRQLVAYVVPADGSAPAGLKERCRSQLRSSLPEYMVPSTYIVLERLPLTPNGKIDRRALPAPAEHDLEKERFVAPRTATERRLCETWQEVLKLAQVGVHDDFFALGGHSLLATRLISAMRESFDVEVPLRMVFEKPTIQEFATWFDIYNAAAAVADDDEAEERFL